MTAGKAGLLTAGLVAVFAIGVLAGPTIRDSWSTAKSPEARSSSAVAAHTAPVSSSAKRSVARSTPRAHEAVASKDASNSVRTVPVSLWEPELRDRVKAVLNPGARLELAAADFNDAEQFITVAHAARNTDVPFMVLKDRVVNQGQSLTEAIHELKPDLNAKAEVTRARAEARSDVNMVG